MMMYGLANPKDTCSTAEITRHEIKSKQ
jgi:hypothetical protein